MKIVDWTSAWRRLSRGLALTVLALSLAPFARAAAPPDEKSDLVIVPYDSTKPIDAQKPDQLYLPYERFLQLWGAAKQHRAGPPPEAAKFPFALSAARYDGALGERSVAFTGKLDITTYNDAWVKVPLPFKGATLRALKIDGAAAALSGNAVVIEKPGRHTVEVAFDIPLTPGATHFGWGIPQTSATLVALTLADGRTRALITPGSGVIERVENGRNMVTAAIGSTDNIQVELQAVAAVAHVTEPAVASIVTKLAVRSGEEDADARFEFSFPGTRQDRFKVYLENGLTLFGLDALNLKSWKLSPEADRQALEITLNDPVTEKFSFAIQAQRAAPAAEGERVAPVFSAAAKRVEYAGTALLSDNHLEITPKPNSGQRQISWNELVQRETRFVPALEVLRKTHFVAAYAGAGKLAYSVKAAGPRKEARVEYAYQVNRRKIELMASFQLFPKGDDLSAVTLALPPQFEVQAVESAQLQDWWREGNEMRVRLRGAPAVEIPLVVYLKRQYAAAPTELDVRPLALQGFKRVSGEAVIAAHKGVDVTMKLASEDAEIPAEKAATDFQILPPLERKRGFAFKTQNFSALIALSTLPARFNALWVMHARAHEGWLALSAHARLSVRQGSIDRASFTLPKSVPEARVSGDEVREVRSRVEGDQRIYEVQFQNDVSDTVELTLDFELPDAEEATLPPITFPGAQMTSGYVLTENSSEYEMRLKTSNVDQAPASEIPFLPELSKGAGIFRVQPDWSVSIALDRLEKAESRAAFVAWAEMTSALRADGTEWHRASYRLQNRSLQFLPVRLPEGAELMSARVAGQNVRADTGRVDGREALLVPLIKTKPGDLSYDVDLVYRITGPLPGWRVKREFLEPELPGITVERTLWNVWLPDDRKLENSGGNMEPVLGDLNQTEKLEGKLQELKQLVTIASSSQASEDTRQNARRSLGVLKEELEAGNRDDQFSETSSAGPAGVVPKPTPGDEILGKKSLASQGDYVASKRKALKDELGQVMQKLSEAPPSAPAPQESISVPQNGSLSPSAQWTSNTAYSGKAAAATPAPLNSGLNGNLYLNDNIVLQQREANSTKGTPGIVSTGGMNATKGSPPIQQAEASAPAAKGQSDVILQTARSNYRRSQNEKTVAQEIEKRPESVAQGIPPAIPAPPNSVGRLSLAGSGRVTLSGVNTYTGGANPRGTISAPLEVPLLPAGATAPAAPPADMAAPAAAAPLPRQAENAANPSPKSEAERLQPTGRISLAVDFPTEGQIYHFKKVKASARLELTVMDPSVFGRWRNLALFLVLGGALYGAGRLLERRSAARTPRPHSGF